MAKRISYKPYFFLIAALFMLFGVSARRFALIDALAPVWRFLDRAPAVHQEHEQLLLENRAMKQQLEELRSYLLFEDRLENEWQRYKELSQETGEELFWKDFFHRRADNLCENLKLQYQALFAKVIFREPLAWSSAVWLNVGQEDNQLLGKTVVAKNSPVLSSTGALVGLVEEVKARKCRVRLITDPGLACAVRAVRGSEQDRQLLRQIETLLAHLHAREDLSADAAEPLAQLKEQLQNRPHQDSYLAKGELCGSGEARWRAHTGRLKGVGFNYDFADAEGAARDLRTGPPLLKIGDLLVTTGMDGVFPRDLPVATITKILPLREGGCSYDIEANALADNLQEMRDLLVLPPIQ
jgi:cell shape-determining protein MreC